MDLEALLQQAKDAFDCEDYEAAILNYQEALLLNFDLYEAHLNIGRAQDNMGKYEAAIVS
jgi:tetratricopeptide (TPR) repeat protein